MSDMYVLYACMYVCMYQELLKNHHKFIVFAHTWRIKLILILVHKKRESIKFEKSFFCFTQPAVTVCVEHEKWRTVSVHLFAS